MIKYIFILKVFLLEMPFFMYCQTKWVEKDSGSFQNLSVIKYQENDKMKNGKYEVYTKGILIQKGFYKNDKIDSNWSYYCNGKIAAKRYYKENNPISKWIFYDSNAKVVAVYDWEKEEYFISDKKLKYKKVDFKNGLSQVYPLFSDFEFKCFMQNNILYPKAALRKEEHGWVEARLKINKSGKVEDYKITQKISESLEEETIQKLQLFPFLFIPAYKDGKPIEDYYFITVKFPQTLL